VPGIVAALSDLAATGCALGVLTSNSRENAERFLSRHGFPSFAQIVGGVGLFGKAKALRQLLRSRSAGAERCAYVGDEVRDVEAAREVGMPVVAVGWGYNDPKALEKAGPDAQVVRPSALARSIIALLGPPHAEASP
jgi:phosphoglycolate phosphatase